MSSALAKTCGPSGAWCSSDDCLANCAGDDEANDRTTCLLDGCSAVSTCDQILSQIGNMYRDGTLSQEYMNLTVIPAVYKRIEGSRIDVGLDPEIYGISCLITWADDVKLYQAIENKKKEYNPGVISSFGSFKPIEGGFGWSSGSNTLTDYIIDVLSIGRIFFVGLATLKIIFGGVMYGTAAGNAQRITEAKSHIFYALLGIALISGATIILWLFGANPLIP